ncbi:MAG: DUF3369 domain-containing protein [Methylococcales bacterium]|jgi:response regulator RpfG family c-di-GMP phosphodiesterase|nr:DUF3369 domain-containing protein [Methylococcales bacterium]MBT7410567.1 DUF3369 domain-containing protein [Methylococcales bacterium]
MSDDDFIFVDEDPTTDSANALDTANCWKVLIIDDDEEVHKVSLLAMRQIEYSGKHLSFLHAYSAKEGRELIRQNPDVAVILLDVVMEEEDAGLKLVEYIRKDLKNLFPRIILRTGQPGSAPEKEVIYKYDINDYKEKTELTANKLYITIISALRAFEDIVRIERGRKGLSQLIKSANELFKSNNLDSLIACLLEQILSLTGLEKNALYSNASTFYSELPMANHGHELRVVSGTGRFSKQAGKTVAEVVDTVILEKIRQKKSFYSKEYRLVFTPHSTHEGFIFIEDGEHEPDDLEIYLLELLAVEASIAYENAQLNQDLVDTQKDIIQMLGSLAEFKSNETGQHVIRVGEYTALLAQKIGLPNAEVELLRLAAPMHDIGKIGIPDIILHKPGKLTAEEFKIMKKHTTIGYECLEISQKPLIQAAAIIALQHQEKWDGSGYPHGLNGEEIHLYARLTALADVFDALLSSRSYKPAWPENKVKSFIEEQKGVHFDPTLSQLLLDSFDEFLNIRHHIED